MSKKNSKVVCNPEAKIEVLISHLLNGTRGSKTHLSKKTGICRKTVCKHLKILTNAKVVIHSQFGDDRSTYFISEEHRGSKVKDIIRIVEKNKR